ncbi:MAG: AAA family ATPase [Methyloceanibacter sp.]
MSRFDDVAQAWGERKNEWWKDEQPGEPVQLREPRIKLVPFDAIELGTEPAYLVHGLIPRVGLTVIWGPPKSGKSYWKFDLSMHVALGWPYRGRRVQQGPIVYCAFEGQAGIRRRCEAFRQRFLGERSEPVPFYLMPLTLDLVHDHRELIEAIKNTLGDCPPVGIDLDTLNRSMRGSESSDEDMTAYVQAADALRETFACSVSIVHHCGIDGTRPRGHTSLSGAVDAQIAVKRDQAETVICTVETMKDGPEGDIIASRLEPIIVGTDSDGEDLSACIVLPAEPPTFAAMAKQKLTPNQQSMLNLLDDAGAAGLSTEEWNDKARAEGIGVKRRSTFMDARKALKDRKLIHSYADHWYVT